MRIGSALIGAAVGLAAVIANPAPSSADAIRLGADVDAGTLDPRVQRDTTAYRVNNLIYDGLALLSG